MAAGLSRAHGCRDADFQSGITTPVDIQATMLVLNGWEVRFPCSAITKDVSLMISRRKSGDLICRLIASCL